MERSEKVVTEMKLGTKFWTSHESVFISTTGGCKTMELPAGYMVEVYYVHARSSESPYCCVAFTDELGDRWVNNSYRWR